jgi:hypothetical protein
MANTLLNLNDVEFVDGDNIIISKDPVTYENVGGEIAKVLSTSNVYTALHFCNEISKRQKLEPVYHFDIEPLIKKRGYSRNEVLEICQEIVRTPTSKEGSFEPTNFFDGDTSFAQFKKVKAILKDHSLVYVHRGSPFSWDISDKEAKPWLRKSFWTGLRFNTEFAQEELTMKNKEYFPLVTFKDGEFPEITVDQNAGGFRLTTLEEEHKFPSSKVCYVRDQEQRKPGQVDLVCHRDLNLDPDSWWNPKIGPRGVLGTPTCESLESHGFRIARKV